MTLGPADLMVLLGIIGIPSTLMLFNLKAVGQRMDRLEDEVRAMERVKVDKTLWARSDVTTRAKVDEVVRLLSEMNGRMESHYGVAPAITRLATEVGKLAETNK